MNKSATTHRDLAIGAVVSYDGRAQGVKVGTVQKREVITAYRVGDPELVYYHITTADLLVPAEDILDVMAAKA